MARPRESGYPRGMNAYALAAALALALTAAAVQAANPIAKGWYADPEVAVYGKTYWVFPTYSDDYDKQTFLDAFSSPDLVHWTKHHKIISTDQVKWAKRAVWAPCTVEKGGKYYIFFAANDVHEGEVGGIGVGVADRPGGPYKDLIGKPLINQIVHGAQPIDQSVFKAPDGQWYILYGGWGHCNLAKLKADFTALEKWPDGSTFKEITPDGYTEGPLMFFKGGKVYFMWSEGGWTGPNYKVAYAIGDSVTGPFKRIGTVIQPDPSIANGAGHHSVLNVPGTDDWYIAYHRRPAGETAGNHRETAIDVMKFNPDGTISPVVMTKQGVAPQRVGAPAAQ